MSNIVRVLCILIVRRLFCAWGAACVWTHGCPHVMPLSPLDDRTP